MLAAFTEWGIIMPEETGASPARYEDLLVEPREQMHIEIKEWLDLVEKGHRANLAKEIIALANYGGGFILLGFKEENDGAFIPANTRPANLDCYSQDVINEIVRTYVDPSFHCAVHHEEHPAGAGKFPIIVVPGGHRQPVMARRGSPDNTDMLARTVYCRRPGPVSEQPQSADEWRDLMDRCLRNGKEEMLDAIRGIMSGGSPAASPQPSDSDVLNVWTQEGEQRWQTDVAAVLPDGHPGRFPLGYYEFSYLVLGDIQVPDMRGLLSMLEQAKVRYTGWPCWWVPSREGIRPYPADGAIQCALALDTQPQVALTPDHCDFWRASPEGKLFLMRGYNEDAHENMVAPGKGFDITTPTWRLGEALLHASAMSKLLAGDNGEVLFQAKWYGLAGRELVSIGNPRRMMWDGHTCRQNSYITPQVRLKGSDIPDALPEIVNGMLKPLYELFDFFRLPPTLAAEELASMRGNRF